MNMEQLLKQEQRLTLSPRQALSLEILSMDNSMLEAYIEEQQLENPILEVQKERDSYEEMAALGKWFQKNQWNQNTRIAEVKESELEEGLHNGVDSLKNHLLGQLCVNTCTEEEMKILDFLIDSLDDRGYLQLSPEQVAGLMHTTVFTAQKCICLLQTLEPDGVGAAGFIQCLLLQAKKRGADQEVQTLIEKYMTDIGEGHFKKISREMGISKERINESILFIRSLNPIPINGYSQNRTEYIVPDVIFLYHDGEWQVEINDSWIGSIGISSMYMKMAKEEKDPEILNYFAKKIEAAHFVIKCVEQRRNTLKNVSQFILDFQKDFFAGTGALKPLNLKQAANALGIHESTVSRTLKDKYVAGPQGTLLLKRCFDRGLAGAGDSREASKKQVMDRLHSLIQEEDKKKPYSDQMLAELLEQEGICISRRAITKYREAVGVPNAYVRKIGSIHQPEIT